MYFFFFLQNGVVVVLCGYVYLDGLVWCYCVLVFVFGLLVLCVVLVEIVLFILFLVQVQEQCCVMGDYVGGQVVVGGCVGLFGDKDFMDMLFNMVSYIEFFICDCQVKDLIDVIVVIDFIVFSNGVIGVWSENYVIRGFVFSISDIIFNGLIGMVLYYCILLEMFECIEVLKGLFVLFNGMLLGGLVGGSVNLVFKCVGEQLLQWVSVNFVFDVQFGIYVDIGCCLGIDKQFGICFNGVYCDGDGVVGKQCKKVQFGLLVLDWCGECVWLLVDLYSVDDCVDGFVCGVGFVLGVVISWLLCGDMLINLDWVYVDSQDKGVMLCGELDISDSLMVYLVYGISKIDYCYNGLISVQIFNLVGDFIMVIGQFVFDIRKQFGDVGLCGLFYIGSVCYQWVVNVIYYQYIQNDYGCCSVLGWDWIINLYNLVWGLVVLFVVLYILYIELWLDSIGVVDIFFFVDDCVQLMLGVCCQQVVSEIFNVVSGVCILCYDESVIILVVVLLVKVIDMVFFYINYIEGFSQGVIVLMIVVNVGDVFVLFCIRQKELGLKFDLGCFVYIFSVYEIK